MRSAQGWALLLKARATLPDLDAPHWSWLHGCRKHRGQPAPCKECLRLRDPDVTQDGHKMFIDASQAQQGTEPYPGYNAAWQDYIDYLNGTNP